MHEEVLSDNQRQLRGLLKIFSDPFYLVGGTAMAFQLGHRRSIDFDFATNEQLDSNIITQTVREKHKIQRVFVDEKSELSIVVNDVKLTFFHYPFNITHEKIYKGYISMPNLLSLAAMKAYALGRRAKWKDYVDLYFIFEKYLLKDVVNISKKIFDSEFNEKLFREQLSYFEDIDYSEKVDFLNGFEIDDDKVKNLLTKISLQK